MFRHLSLPVSSPNWEECKTWGTIKSLKKSSVGLRTHPLYNRKSIRHALISDSTS